MIYNTKQFLWVLKFTMNMFIYFSALNFQLYWINHFLWIKILWKSEMTLLPPGQLGWTQPKPGSVRWSIRPSHSLTRLSLTRPRALPCSRGSSFRRRRRRMNPARSGRLRRRTVAQTTRHSFYYLCSEAIWVSLPDVAVRDPALG